MRRVAALGIRDGRKARGSFDGAGYFCHIRDRCSIGRNIAIQGTCRKEAEMKGVQMLLCSMIVDIQGDIWGYAAPQAAF